MEASEEILLNSLANSGVPIPPGVSSLTELTPPTLYAICCNGLRLIDHRTPSFPASLPEDSDSMAERVNACTELASAFRNLGFVGDLSFHKFLYPSEEDLYKLVRFFVERLSESSEAPKPVLGDAGDKVTSISKEKEENEGDKSMQNEKDLTGLEDLRMSTSKPESCNIESEDNESRDRCSSSGSQGIDSFGQNAFRDRDDPQNNGLQNQEETFIKQSNERSSELQHLEEEFQLLKAAVGMVFDNQQPLENHLQQLSDKVEAKRHKLNELESEWDATEKSLQEKKGNLKQSLLETRPEAYEKLARSKEVEVEIESVYAEIRRREDELSKLSLDYEKQPKLPLRKSYIERINEITKNSRKQDADIQRILKDTRELQLESNTIQARLNRTYAVVDETIFREAKKDPVARQAYRLLTNIHESFEQIAEKILATDRLQRDAADYEAKLASISIRSLDVSKLQSDLDAIRKENDLLEQRLRNA